MYNTTFMNNTGSLLDYVTGINDASNSVFSIMILIVLWIIIFISMKHFDMKQLLAQIGGLIR